MLLLRALRRQHQRPRTTQAIAKTPPPVAPPMIAPLGVCVVDALDAGVADAEEADVADADSDEADVEAIEDVVTMAEVAVVVVATVAGTVKVDPPAKTTVWTPAGLRSEAGHPWLQGLLSQQP